MTASMKMMIHSHHFCSKEGCVNILYEVFVTLGFLIAFPLLVKTIKTLCQVREKMGPFFSEICPSFSAHQKMCLVSDFHPQIWRRRRWW